MKFESERIAAQPVRRVVIVLPEDRAAALGLALDTGIVWADTDVQRELEALHEALVQSW